MFIVKTANAKLKWKEKRQWENVDFIYIPRTYYITVKFMYLKVKRYGLRTLSMLCLCFWKDGKVLNNSQIRLAFLFVLLFSFVAKQKHPKNVYRY